MNSAELHRLFQPVAKKIVTAEIPAGPGALPHGAFERAPLVIATLDDGSHVELFSFYTRTIVQSGGFVGLTVEEGRTLKFAPGHAPRPDGSV